MQNIWKHTALNTALN